MSDDFKDALRPLGQMESTKDLWALAQARSKELPSRKTRSQARTRGARWRRPAVLATSLAAATAGLTGVAVLSHSHPSNLSPSSPTQSVGGTQSAGGALEVRAADIGSNPFGATGTVTTLSQLEAMLPYPVMLPNTNLANNGSLGTVWVDNLKQHGALYYPSSGIEILLYPTATAFAFTGTPVRTINGRQAVVFDPDPAASPAQPAKVDMIVGNHALEIIGFRSSADLVQVADSLSPASS
jgi:hypothetical protein